MPKEYCAMTTDFSCFAKTAANGEHELFLQVDGMRCASCAWRIESALNAHEHVNARINFSTERLHVTWQGEAEQANDFVKEIEELGFKAAPFSQEANTDEHTRQQKFLLRCLAVAGFAAGNLMLFSLALWFSHGEDMGAATRDMMHWIMGLIALPAIIYSGRPFFYSAISALKAGHTNMDVPISLAVILAAVMSVHETAFHGPYVYFDASVMLLFFLLIGRYLDQKARGRAREAAQGLLAMLEGTATIMEEGVRKNIAIRDIRQGMHLLVATGEKIAADGVVTKGVSEVDSSVITGETLPRDVKKDSKVYAGMVNLFAPLEVDVSAAGDASLLADIVGLMEKAEQSQARYVVLADKVAALYTPVVHVLALATFFGWWMGVGVAWQQALLTATAVLIITCPCALGLAVPVVQVLAGGILFKRGMLVKSGNALEKLAIVNTVFFDKTGTLTLGTPHLTNAKDLPENQFQLAASMAAYSHHPLAKAVVAAWDGKTLELDAEEVPGHGMQAHYEGNMLRLGKRSWCGPDDAPADGKLEMWLNDGTSSTRLVFADTLRADAKEMIATLHAHGFATALISGDRTQVAESLADELGIHSCHAELTPVEKTDLITQTQSQGHHVLMVGDGLNDAPALASADVSISPSSAIDITQNAADIVFRGERLMPVWQAITTAKNTHRLVKQNFALALLYNALAVPLAMFGHVTPLIAAIAMSGSSLIVIGNAFRLKLKS